MAWWEMVIVGLAALGALIGFITASFRTGKWVGSVNSDRESFKAFMDEVRGKLDKIFERLPPPKAVSPGSPVTLTDFGRDISTRLSVEGWADNQAPQLVEGMQEKEEFEIFDLCIEYVGKQIEESPDFAKTMRANAYQIGTDFENVRKVYEVELRDAILRLLGPHTP